MTAVPTAAARVAPTVALLDTPDTVRLALSPIRQQLLARLSRPASATTLAGELAMGRQRINYHLRALETAGLLALVEERQKRGCVERVLVARARAFVVDPAVVAGREPSNDVDARPGDARARAQRAARRQDRFSASHLIAAASTMVCDVTRMQGRAAERGERLLTFTLDTDIAFATPADFERFTSRLAERIARMAAEFHQPSGGRRYRIIVGGHPSSMLSPDSGTLPGAAETGRPSGRRSPCAAPPRGRAR